MYLQYLKGKKDMVCVKPAMLECWWPRPGAFNVKGSAIYIARRAQRNMRKSAVSGDHYFVKWGTPYGKDVMVTLRDGPDTKTLRQAAKMLSTGSMTSVAISRDIIIYVEDDTLPDVYEVVFRGIECGKLVRGSYEPSFSDNPLTGRVVQQLEEIV
jgi:hypothetical protein